MNRIANRSAPLIYLVTGILNIYNKTVAAQTPQSPCPQYFTYQSDGYQYYGLLDVPPIQIGDNLAIILSMSIAADLPNKNYGSLQLLGNEQQAIQNILGGKNIQYKISFPLRSPLPKLTSISYNQQEICYGPPDVGRTITNIRLEHLLRTENLGPNRGTAVNRPANNVPNFASNSYQTTSRPAVISEQYEFILGPNGELIQKPLNVQTPSRPVNTVGNSYQGNIFQSTTKEPSLDDLLEPYYGNKQPTTNKNQQQSQQQNHGASSFNSDKDVCGRPILTGNPLILNGTPTVRGEFPWLVAIYAKKSKSLQFQCGATLISKSVVLTAAHCVLTKEGDTISISELVLFIGRNNIEDWTEDGFLSPKINDIISHSEYKKSFSGSFDADIAVIRLKQTVTYTQYIRPACLWDMNIDVNQIVSETAVVVGWGKDTSGNVTSTPNKVNIPIVSESVCLRSHESYRYLTSNRTFCAGNKDGSGPCNGDSGGPLTIKRNGRWYLRGIVSASLLDPDTNSCDVRNYVVFTDVAQFLPWIQSFL